jgi:RND family efflux transporter MFP subunit
VRDTGEYLGSLISRGSVNVLPQVGGYVKKIHVRPGQKVEAGAPLVDIDARTEAAALDSAVAQVKSSEARLGLAKQTLTRTQALYDEGLASAQELERVRSDLLSAEAAHRVSSSVVSQSEVRLNFHTVRAAVPGTIGEVPIRTGDAVTPNTLLTSIAQAEVLELSVAIPAARARVLPPQAVVEVLDNNGKVLVSASAFYVAPQADPLTQLVVVKAVFENKVGLRPSELVRARIVFGQREALTVPSLSVVRQSGQPFAFVVTEKDGKTIVARRPITLGPLVEQSYVVESGVTAGERVAVSSLQALRDGAAVEPRVPGPATAQAAPAPAAPAPAAR